MSSKGPAVKIEGPKFRFWTAPDISAEEWLEMGSTICRILVAGPPAPLGHRRRVAVRQALHLYSGARSNRAKRLADRYRQYLATGWLREHELETLPYPRTTERVLLHRLARLNEGAPLRWRRIFDIASSRE